MNLILQQISVNLTNEIKHNTLVPHLHCQTSFKKHAKCSAAIRLSVHYIVFFGRKIPVTSKQTEPKHVQVTPKIEINY